VGRTTKLVRRLAAGFNRRRYERVTSALALSPSDVVVELGCGRGGDSFARYNRTNEIVGIDLRSPERITVDQPNFRYVQGDASNLAGIADGAFDVAVSFGMLEHIQPRGRMIAAIREAQRIAGRYCFVVPHRYAFIEPHFLLPLFPLWPDRLKSFLVARFALGSQRRTPDGQWQRIWWLSKEEWRSLFDDPNLRIVDHWYGPILLDYLIFGGQWPSPRPPAPASARRR
jgi:SAM-dependent methyltransferase